MPLRGARIDDIRCIVRVAGVDRVVVDRYVVDRYVVDRAVLLADPGERVGGDFGVADVERVSGDFGVAPVINHFRRTARGPYRRLMFGSTGVR